MYEFLRYFYENERKKQHDYILKKMRLIEFRLLMAAGGAILILSVKADKEISMLKKRISELERDKKAQD